MVIRERVDVLVVGAGPAGCTAAEHAAAAGAEVLIVERRPTVGVPVRCGEFIPSITEVGAIFPEAEGIETLFDIPDGLISLHTHKIRIYSPRSRPYEIDFDGFTVDRDRFDQHLAAKAERAGARLRTGCRMLRIKGNEVLVNGGSVQAEVIIGADGPRSRVASCVGLPRSMHLCPAVTSQVEGDFEPVAEMYFGNVAPGGYAWVLPKKNGANVGVGVSPRFARDKLVHYLRGFTDHMGFEIADLHGKEVPMSGPVPRTVEGDVLIVGDAAGQVMAVNGGGIPLALICGRVAGIVASDHVANGTPLAEYENRWRRMVGGPLQTAVRSSRLASLCWGSSTRLEVAMRVLGERRMGKLIRCKFPFP